jgi:hypothetical protein
VPDSTNKPSEAAILPLLTDVGLKDLTWRWTKRQVLLARKLSRLPHDGTTMGHWGIVFGIDNLRKDPAGVAMLLDVVDELDKRPTYEELLEMVERLWVMRKEVNDAVWHQGRQPTKQFGFRRGK